MNITADNTLKDPIKIDSKQNFTKNLAISPENYVCDGTVSDYAGKVRTWEDRLGSHCLVSCC